MIDLLADAWRSYQAQVLPADAPAIQIQECRRAFYAGAQALFQSFLAIGDDSVEEEAGVNFIEAVGHELETFKADVVEGRA